MPFHHFELRTTDLVAARAFYEAVLEGPFDALLTELPEAAKARGAPAHWLGHLFLPPVERTLERFLAAGATALGPARETDDGHRIIGLRDPFGAVVALTDRDVGTVARARPVHFSASPEAARALYGVDADFLPIDGPAMHPQWVFPIVVRDVTQTLARILAAGGRGEILPVREGFQVAVAEDPQGGAFAVLARVSSHQALGRG
jgi:uncharacterized protein